MNFEENLSYTAGQSQDAKGKENTLPPVPAHSKVTKKGPYETQAHFPKEIMILCLPDVTVHSSASRSAH